MDSCSLMYDFEGTAMGFYISDFEEWLREHCEGLKFRQLLSEFIVEQILGKDHRFSVLASDSNHIFRIAKSTTSLILCDFNSSSVHDVLHLDSWVFYHIDCNEINGIMSVEELMTYDPVILNYFTLDNLSKI